MLDCAGPSQSAAHGKIEALQACRQTSEAVLWGSVSSVQGGGNSTYPDGKEQMQGALSSGGA